MADLAITNKHHLMLIFKDDLPQTTGQGFPLVSESPTILRHFAIIDPKRILDIKDKGVEIEELLPSVSPQVSLFPDDTSLIKDKLWPEAILGKCCVWGWWRKPWEYHPHLFESISNYCQGGKTLKVLLYNDYFMKTFQAKLHGIYYLPYLTTIQLPWTWRDKCPSYYRDNPRLCGAFFLLELNWRSAKVAKQLLSSLVVDADSFEITPKGLETVIPPDENIENIVLKMVDKPIDRIHMRSSEHTLFLLRNYRQIETTRKLLARRSSINDEMLADAFIETDWHDIKILLNETGPQGWKNLVASPKALSVIGDKSKKAGSRITRFDLDLAAWAFSSQKLKDLLVETTGKTKEFTELGNALRNWVAADSGVAARASAVFVFKEAWKAASAKYNLSDFSAYFDNLPALEAIASSVHYEIDKKFYRDHLNHNIRSALLAAWLADVASPQLPTDINPHCIAFFSGLFHDIAFPISSYPDTIEKLASALATIKINTTKTRPQSLLETKFLRLSLNYVALLSSVPSILDAYPDGCIPWDKPVDSIAPANARLLQELLLCAKSEEHSVISSAILFHRAVAARCTEDFSNIDSGVRTLMAEMTGKAATSAAREFLAILQCIALHDRKASLDFHPVATYPRDAPAPLLWEQYSLPIIVSISDEFQEWGRPVGALESIGIVDAILSYCDKKVKAVFEWNNDPTTFSAVPYSLLYTLFSKLRTCGQFRCSSGTSTQPMSISCTLSAIEVFHIEYLSHREFEIEFAQKTFSIAMNSWPEERITNKQIGEDGQHLFRICLDNGENQGHDYLIVQGDADACEALISLSRCKIKLEKFEIDGVKFHFEFVGNTMFSGRIMECHFGKIQIKNSIPAGQYPESGACCVFKLLLEPSPEDAERTLETMAAPNHLLPHPHFLDFDWRFTEHSAKWIVQAAKYYAEEKPICYLGCPTLAIWHSTLNSSDNNWILLDRGHFALEKWIDNTIPRDRWREYDVFNPLPADLARKFAVVVTDPPWYAPDYDAFCKRVEQLILPGGLAFISSYPPFRPYKADKHMRFSHVIKNELGKPTWLGSMEIDYEIPEFELSWEGHKQFQHLGLGVYRPGYLDVYRCVNKVIHETDGQATRRFLSKWQGLSGNHHIRYSTTIEYPCTVRIERRKKLKRPLKNELQNIIAWTSKNAIVQKRKRGIEVANIAELISHAEEWENKNQ